MSGDEPWRGSVKPLTKQEVREFLRVVKTGGDPLVAACGNWLLLVCEDWLRLKQRLAEAERAYDVIGEKYDRVERERDELLREQEAHWPEWVARAQRAEAQLAQARDALEELRARGHREPLGVDISDFSDEFCYGFLAGQSNALGEALALLDSQPDGEEQP